MLELEASNYSVELVPTAILNIVEQNGLVNDVKSVLSLRLLSKMWNSTLSPLVGARMVTVLSQKNLREFSEFLSSETSMELRESNIRSVVLRLSSKADFKKTLDEFVKLPAFFRTQVGSLKLQLDVNAPRLSQQLWKFLNEAQLINLEELEIVVDQEECKLPAQILPPRSVSLENIRFQFLRRLTVPIYMSVQFLQTCPVLTSLTLHVFKMSLCPDFWDSFKTEVCLRGLNESIDELFFVDKLALCKGDARYSFGTLFQCNFKLKKLGLGFSFQKTSAEECLEFFRFLTQQSDTIEYLELPSYMASNTDNVTLLSDAVLFPKLVEIKLESLNAEYHQLLIQSPHLENICFPKYCFVNGHALNSFNAALKWNSPTIKSVKVGHSTFFSESSFLLFPNLESLEFDDRFDPTHLSTKCLTPGTNLKKLSIKVRANIIHERRLKRQDQRYVADHSVRLTQQASRNRQKMHERPIKADCFILGQEPRHCKPYQRGSILCDETTKFPIPSAPSICNFHSLKYLCLQGYFTELTIWAGIKTLTQLQEFHLRTQYKMHPSTLIKLEAYLTQLRTWSYTKLGETEVLAGEFFSRDMYKCYRKLPTILPQDQLHVWKFNDDDVEKKIVTLMEFDVLDLRYKGKVKIVPDGFWPEPKSESD